MSPISVYNENCVRNYSLKKGDTNMSANIITITREFGSGGRTIGRAVASALGYDFYDWNLVEQIARESGFSQQFVEEHAEDASTSFPWIFKNAGAGMDTTDQLYLIQCKIINQLADKGHCVIVGRCADYILRDRPDVLNCFVFAEDAYKKERIIVVYGETEVAIEKRMKEKDRKRKAFYQYYTGRKWGTSFYYDLCLDSGRLGIDTCTALITQAARTFEGGAKAIQE